MVKKFLDGGILSINQIKIKKMKTLTKTITNRSICENGEKKTQHSALHMGTGRISQLSCILAEKALIDKHKLLPEDLVDDENNYLPEYQDDFNNYYDYYYNELSIFIK